jgi:hypothetical protein
MNINIELGVFYYWIPQVLVNYIFSGTIQENVKRMNSRRLQKTPELNQSAPPRKYASRRDKKPTR